MVAPEDENFMFLMSKKTKHYFIIAIRSIVIIRCVMEKFKNCNSRVLE